MTVFTLFSLTMILVIATVEDLSAHRISNVVVGCGLLLGLASQFLVNGSTGLLHGLIGAATGLAILLPFYVVRVMGAGDVKLMAAVGSFLVPHSAIFAALYTLIAGGVVGIALMVRHHALKTYRSRSPQYATLTELGVIAAEPESIRKHRFPYAIAIAIGTLASLWIRDEINPLFAIFGGT